MSLNRQYGVRLPPFRILPERKSTISHLLFLRVLGLLLLIPLSRRTRRYLSGRRVGRIAHNADTNILVLAPTKPPMPIINQLKRRVSERRTCLVFSLFPFPAYIRSTWSHVHMPLDIIILV